MKCNLCLEDTELLRRSHIIPQFMYRGVKSDGGIFIIIDKYTFREYSKGKSLKEHSTGAYDSNILCENCDNKIFSQKYEDYSSKVYQFLDGEIESFKGIEIKPYRNEKGVKGKLIKNIDYAKFKLFLLSILWIASISKRPFFQEVALGDKHEQAGW